MTTTEARTYDRINSRHAYQGGRQARLARIRANRRKEMMRRRMRLTILTLTIAMISLFTLSGFSRPDESQEVFRYYTTVSVDRGDTLWSIAAEHENEVTPSMRTYMKEIRQINNMRGSKVTYGQKLVLPYYSTELQ